ncbi:MAG: hypothetical protein Q4C53_06640 [Clostridia bacterium]|nr:hypothetical protein [Clostridia bacterium]
MYCKFCGAPLKTGSAVCKECGREQNAPYAECSERPVLLKSGKFWWRNYFRKWQVIVPAVLCLALAAWVAYLGWKDPLTGLWILFDVGVLAGCGVMLFLTRMRLFAVALAAYSVAVTVFTVLSGTVPGAPVLARLACVWLTSVLAVYGTFRFRSHYKRYKQEYRLRYPAGKKGANA